MPNEIIKHFVSTGESLNTFALAIVLEETWNNRAYNDEKNLTMNYRYM